MSDASPLAGLPDGEYEWEHEPVFIRDSSCRLADGTIAEAHALSCCLMGRYSRP